ncbi:MAG TPA: PorV/PorQ family protein [Rhodothermales bacterium]|nr:PorV/PorQ family protein [Rhodothermales bacterium]
MRSRLALLALAGSMAATAAGAQDMTKAGQAGMTFLKVGVGAGPAAMGGAYVGSGGDALALFWNPAGIAQLSASSLSLNETQWLAGTRQHAVGAAVPLGRWGVLGVSATVMDYGTLHGTTIGAGGSSEGFEYEETGDFRVSEYAIGLGYAYAITDRFSVGGQVKHVASSLGTSEILVGEAAQTIKNETAAFAFDLGTQYRTAFNGLTFGMSVRNVSGEVAFPHMFEDFFTPLVYSFGVSMEVLPAAMRGTHRMVVAADALHPNDGAERLHTGVEYSFQDRVFLRGGVRFNDDVETFSAGAGLRTRLGPTGLRLDYAATAMRYFDVVHRLSLGLSL